MGLWVYGFMGSWVRGFKVSGVGLRVWPSFLERVLGGFRVLGSDDVSCNRFLRISGDHTKNTPL